tara:strand:+ start:19136 stop:20935 length:1800 start_codon:yes stop_codon:yes gene_type:complete
MKINPLSNNINYKKIYKELSESKEAFLNIFNYHKKRNKDFVKNFKKYIEENEKDSKLKSKLLNILSEKVKLVDLEALSPFLNKSSNYLFENAEKIVSKDDFKSIIEKEIIDDEELFYNYFSNNVKKSQVKEAISWIIGYLKTGDYDQDKILHYDNEVLNKRQTMKNLLKEINKQSLTQREPFKVKLSTKEKEIINIYEILIKNKIKHENVDKIISKGYVKKEKENLLREAKRLNDKSIINMVNFKFYPAGSGELDVCLWSKKNKKIIAMCATSDPSTKIEQNQFFRHFLKAELFSMQVKKNNLSNPREIKNLLNKKNITVRNEELKSLTELTFMETLIKYRKEKNNPQYYKKILSSSEMESILKDANKDLDFIFFGESSDVNNKELKEKFAGFNAVAYLNNLNQYGSVEPEKFTDIVKFLNSKSFSFKYNSVNNKLDFFRKGMCEIIDYINNSSIREANIYLHEGTVYREERKNFLKAVKGFFELIKSTERHNPENFKNATIDFLINNLEIDGNTVKKFMKKLEDPNFIDNFKSKINNIKLSNSESEFPEIRRDIFEKVESISDKIQTRKQHDDILSILANNNSEDARKIKNILNSKKP